MPFVVLVLYGTGFGMAWQCRVVLAHPLAGSFTLLLSINIALAPSVLVHFITAMTLGGTGRVKSGHFKIDHLSVFCNIALIAFLAKAMFYLSW